MAIAVIFPAPLYIAMPGLIPRALGKRGSGHTRERGSLEFGQVLIGNSSELTDACQSALTSSEAEWPRKKIPLHNRFDSRGASLGRNSARLSTQASAHFIMAKCRVHLFKRCNLHAPAYRDVTEESHCRSLHITAADIDPDHRCFSCEADSDTVFQDQRRFQSRNDSRTRPTSPARASVFMEIDQSKLAADPESSFAFNLLIRESALGTQFITSIRCRLDGRFVAAEQTKRRCLGSLTDLTDARAQTSGMRAQFKMATMVCRLHHLDDHDQNNARRGA